MSIERLTQTINANGVAELPGGNFFLLLTASAAVDVRLESRGTSEGADGIIGGVLLERVQPWSSLRVEGAAGTTLEYYVGNVNITEDRTDIRLGVSVVAGTVATAERPSDTVSDLAPITIADVDSEIVIPASATRRRMRIGADTNNAGSCYARTSAAGNNIRELVAGVEYQFDTFDEIHVRNDTGAPAIFYRYEET